MNGLKLDCVDINRLCDATCGEQSRLHWQTRQAVLSAVMDNINWDLLGNVMNKWHVGEHKWLAKHLSGFSATGRVVKRRKEWEHDKCPLCDQSNEDAQHVLSCRSVLDLPNPPRKNQHASRQRDHCAIPPALMVISYHQRLPLPHLFNS